MAGVGKGWGPLCSWISRLEISELSHTRYSFPTFSHLSAEVTATIFVAFAFMEMELSLPTFCSRLLGSILVPCFLGDFWYYGETSLRLCLSFFLILGLLIILIAHADLVLSFSSWQVLEKTWNIPLTGSSFLRWHRRLRRDRSVDSIAPACIRSGFFSTIVVVLPRRSLKLWRHRFRDGVDLATASPFHVLVFGSCYPLRVHDLETYRSCDCILMVSTRLKFRLLVAVESFEAASSLLWHLDRMHPFVVRVTNCGSSSWTFIKSHVD